MFQGADVNAKDKHGISVLLAAIWEGHTKCVEFLIQQVGGHKREIALDENCAPLLGGFPPFIGDLRFSNGAKEKKSSSC